MCGSTALAVHQQSSFAQQLERRDSLFILHPGEVGLSAYTTYRLPFLRIFCNAIRLIDGLVAAADVNVAVVVRVVADEQLIVLQLQLF